MTDEQEELLNEHANTLDLVASLAAQTEGNLQTIVNNIDMDHALSEIRSQISLVLADSNNMKRMLSALAESARIIIDHFQFSN